MKKLVKIVILAALIAAVNISAQNVWNGTGDENWYWNNPSQDEFTITTAEQLAGLAQMVNDGYVMKDKTFTLGADIMLNDTLNWKNWGTTAPARTWKPIGMGSSFQGTFDGAGHVIGGVYINTTSDNQGLFGGVAGAIRNLGVVASYVRGNTSVGGLAGSNSGNITDCYATGNVTGTGQGSIGGLVGYGASNSDITNCYATGNVTGTNRGNVGGLVGSQTNNGSMEGWRASRIFNCYATGNVSGTGGNVGGLVGIDRGGSIAYCYATGNVSRTYHNNDTGYERTGGGLVGHNSGSIVNCYATGNISRNGNVNDIFGGLVGHNNGSIVNCYATGNVSGTGGNYVGGLAGYNYGNIANCYYDRQTSGQSDVGKGMGLTTTEMKDITLVDKLNMGVIANNNLGWFYVAGDYPTFSYTRPSGTVADYFANGDGTQNNPYIIQTPEQLENLYIFVNTGKTFEGEYVKLGDNIMLNDTTNWQNWSTTAPANAWTQIGNNRNQFSGAFDGGGYVIGGVYINNSNSYQGLFGYVGSGGTIRNLGVVASYFVGSGSGGLVGYNSGSITNCYATGNVRGYRELGGLVGYNYYGSIAYCYATGNVVGSLTYGGLVGRNDYDGGTINKCYYDKTTSGINDVYGRTTTEMKRQVTYAGWDFENIWAIDATINNGYPYLLMREAPSSVRDAKKSDSRYGVRFKDNIVKDKLEIADVMLPNDKTVEINVAIYDNTGNVVWSKTQRGKETVWDLTNSYGRIVANGSYLVIVEAKDKNGKSYWYSAKVVVKR